MSTLRGVEQSGTGATSSDRSGEPDPVMIPSVRNFRDIAGPGYRTPYGPMRTGLLFRSSSFRADEIDVPVLDSLGIVAIYDMRGPDEIDRRPDTQLRGARWHHTWVPGLSRQTLLSLQTAAEMRRAMMEHYRGFVNDPEKRAGFASAVAGIVRTSGTQVFHCSEGKDRTGWLAMLLQSLVGVSEADIVADFLLTNERMKGNGPTLDLVRYYFGDRTPDVFEPAMIADAGYLEAGMDQLARDYGDVERYLCEGLGLSDDHLDHLKRLLVDSV